MDENVKEGYSSVCRGMFLGKVEVFSKGVKECKEGFCVVSVSERSKAVVNEMGVSVRRVRT